MSVFVRKTLDDMHSGIRSTFHAASHLRGKEVVFGLCHSGGHERPRCESPEDDANGDMSDFGHALVGRYEADLRE